MPGRRFGTAWQSVAELQREVTGATDAGREKRRVLGVAALIVGLCAVGYFYWNRPPKLSEKDTVVLADFVNNTSDPIFDGTLRQGLAIQLEQSPYLRIMEDEQAQRVLRRMSLAAGAHITNQIAREICVREGAAATIDGAIASLGKSYVITLQSVTCKEGATLARQQVEAEDKEHVLKAVSAAASALRRKLGESLSSIQRLNRPLEEATTGSLEALQIYTNALSQVGGERLLSKAPLFERAIAIDPNFAMAYFLLAVVYEQAGDMARAAEYAERAFRLTDRLSQFERDQITAYHYRMTGEWEKEVDAWRGSVRDYPRNWRVHNQLGLSFIDLGQYDEGLKEGLEGVRLQPSVEPPYRRALDAYICLDRLPEARQLAEKLRAQGLGGARIHQRYLEMAYVDDDQAAAAREIEWFAGKGDEYLSFGLQAAQQNVLGHRRESHQLFARAAASARRLGLGETASEFEEADARADAFVGNCQTARALGRPALALAICGDGAKAEKLAAETSKRFPDGTIWNSVDLASIRAAIALGGNRPAEGAELLSSATPYERAYFPSVYLRGLAYLRVNRGADAAAEFAKIARHKGANWGATWIHPYWAQFYSLSHLGMARGYALAGDTINARKAFQDFFDLWKDADADLLLLQQAKAEYAAL